jgi:electron transfer flavoprotein alpha subunit
MSGVLVYSERDELAFDLLGWVNGVAEEIGPANAAVFGKEASSRAEQYRQYHPQNIYVCSDPELDEQQEHVVAAALAQVVDRSGVDLVLIASTRRGRSLAPRLAQKLSAGCVSASAAIEIALENGKLITGRYALGGNTVSREAVRAEKAVIAVVPGTLEHAQPGEPSGEVISLSLGAVSLKSRVVERRAKPVAAVDIAESDRLVCIGRGLAKKEDLPMIEELARALGGEVSCTRPLSYEYDWLPEDRMIGISGKRCSPQLLLSLGVSGQVQHSVGITGAKIIVAVNSDPNSPIFKLADYGIVGDLYEIVPRLTDRLRRES